jgi:hypothetical protein
MIEQDGKALNELGAYLEQEKANIDATQAELDMVNEALSKDSRNKELRQKKNSLELSLGKSVDKFNKALVPAVEAERRYVAMGEQFERVLGQRALSSMDWDLSNLPELLLGEFSRGAATTLAGYADSGADLTFNIANKFYRGISGEDYWTDKELKAWKKDTKQKNKSSR